MSKSFWRRKRQKVKKGQRKISKSSWRTKGETTWVHENYYLGHKKVVFSYYVFINFFFEFFILLISPWNVGKFYKLLLWKFFFVCPRNPHFSLLGAGIVFEVSFNMWAIFDLLKRCSWLLHKIREIAIKIRK